MKTLLALLTFLLGVCHAMAQRPNATDLSYITAKETGFNQDSLDALDCFIGSFDQNYFKSMVARGWI